MKTEVVGDHVEKVQDLQICEKHDNRVSTLVLKITKKVAVTKSCEEVAGSRINKYIKVCNRHINMNVQIKHPTFFLMELSEKIKFLVKDLKTYEVLKPR